MDRESVIISASEIGQFAYCPRAWWLARVEGCQPADQEALQEGEQFHRRHGRGVRTARMWQGVAYLLIGLSLLAGLLFAFFTVMGSR